MDQDAAKPDIIQRLQKEVFSLQGFKTPCGNNRLQTGLGIIEKAFPYERFPTGAVHELLSYAPEHAAATNGFLAALAGKFLKPGGCCFWIGTKRTIYPPALKSFGIDPERIIFIDVAKEKEALWAFEEALKCESLALVIGEWTELSFTQSRRLQLAVEQSHVTGFVHRYAPKTENNTACIARWKITSLASNTADEMPGVGFPRWQVTLDKVRNGKPGSWNLEWSDNRFKILTTQPGTTTQIIPIRKTG
ncbi:ImuA family protein [Taibaiella soli]|uniref:Error-prone repair protein ImuA n=1 Tax=Taibaiella soli TaxID=1649169 RepID=A0A2W2B216_9BACT|nr:Error-prone repair protein ImuA [Taibaiella soli]PZF74068.1 Error-prone repair protein ImuA [Taibaiella soli]